VKTSIRSMVLCVFLGSLSHMPADAGDLTPRKVYQGQDVVQMETVWTEPECNSDWITILERSGKVVQVHLTTGESSAVVVSNDPGTTMIASDARFIYRLTGGTIYRQTMGTQWEKMSLGIWGLGKRIAGIYSHYTEHYKDNWGHVARGFPPGVYFQTDSGMIGRLYAKGGSYRNLGTFPMIIRDQVGMFANRFLLEDNTALHFLVSDDELAGREARQIYLCRSQLPTPTVACTAGSTSYSILDTSGHVLGVKIEGNRRVIGRVEALTPKEMVVAGFVQDKTCGSKVRFFDDQGRFYEYRESRDYGKPEDDEMVGVLPDAKLAMNLQPRRLGLVAATTAGGVYHFDDAFWSPRAAASVIRTFERVHPAGR
jgi:hypothetical protein